MAPKIITTDERYHNFDAWYDQVVAELCALGSGEHRIESALGEGKEYRTNWLQAQFRSNRLTPAGVAREITYLFHEDQYANTLGRPYIIKQMVEGAPGTVSVRAWTKEPLNEHEAQAELIAISHEPDAYWASKDVIFVLLSEGHALYWIEQEGATPEIADSRRLALTLGYHIVPNLRGEWIILRITHGKAERINTEDVVVWLGGETTYVSPEWAWAGLWRHLRREVEQSPDGRAHADAGDWAQEARMQHLMMGGRLGDHGPEVLTGEEATAFVNGTND